MNIMLFKDYGSGNIEDEHEVKSQQKFDRLVLTV